MKVQKIDKFLKIFKKMYQKCEWMVLLVFLFRNITKLRAPQRFSAKNDPQPNGMHPNHWGAPQIKSIGVHPPLGCGRNHLCLGALILFSKSTCSSESASKILVQYMVAF